MGKYSISKINKSISDTNFVTDNVKYLFAKLDKKDFKEVMRELAEYPETYTEVINDKNELTIIVPRSLWDDTLSKKFSLVDSLDDLAIITCDVDETVTGYLQAITSILSPHNISVFVQGAFTTDHIFVEYTQLDEALRLLNQLKED